MDIRVRDAGDLRRLAKDLRGVADGKELRKELTGALRTVLRPVAKQVKAAYLAGPSQGHSSRSFRSRNAPGIRASLAKATRVEVRTAGKLAGARLRVDGRKMPPRLGSIPRMYEGGGSAGRWRHPVYGPHESEAWVQQPSRPTFYRTIEPYEDFAGRAVDGILEGVRDKLERSR